MKISFSIGSKPVLLAVTALVLSMALSACGFQLRGADGRYNLPFNKIYIGLPVSAPLAIDLKRNIRAIGTTEIASDAASADGIIDVLRDPEATRSKSILSLNATGRVAEYLLNYTIVFKVRDQQGNELLGPTTIGLTRALTFNENRLLANEQEETILYRNMQSDLVQQMLRRLAALKPVITSSPVPVSVPAAASAPAPAAVLAAPSAKGK
jgi:LPS-assembly lipoprotein